MTSDNLPPPPSVYSKVGTFLPKRDFILSVLHSILLSAHVATRYYIQSFSVQARRTFDIDNAFVMEQKIPGVSP